MAQHKSAVRVALTLTLLAAVGIVAFWQHSGSVAKAQAAPDRLAAFERPQAASDALPSVAADELMRRNGNQQPASRLLAAANGIRVFAVHRSDGWYCLVADDAPRNLGSIGCNDYPSVERGYLYSASPDNVAGVVPDDVKSVTVRSLDGTAQIVDVRGGGYIADVKRASEIRFVHSGAPVTVAIPNG